ncbi:hypothetical protein SMD11_0322 [Streptomyces albireticuli]|uniref:Uncharacterized protein n=1 Tax=Streptomyces albireticuli TaxID=1940 RepID=A0A1Z2KVA1_9ACTN|nr:hypothetical protein SMD11_0322 [Streptomyces albireticuli]
MDGVVAQPGVHDEDALVPHLLLRGLHL